MSNNKLVSQNNTISLKKNVAQYIDDTIIKHVYPGPQATYDIVKKKYPDIRLVEVRNYLLSKPSRRENGRLIYSGFEFAGGRGKETLLRYVAIEQKEPTRQYFKDSDEEN